MDYIYRSKDFTLPLKRFGYSVVVGFLWLVWIHKYIFSKSLDQVTGKSPREKGARD
jgi:low temperature requirement protein LtrA